MLRIVEKGHYSKDFQRMARNFCKQVGQQMVLGIYRSASAAPPYLFFSHIDHACEAALIAMADSVLQEHRGFPMLIDLADMICSTTFGNDIFNHAVQMAYTHAGEPFRFLNERQTRARR